MAERTMPAQDAPGPGEVRPPRPGEPPAASRTLPEGTRPDLIRRPDPLAISTPIEFTHAFATLREQAGVSVRDLARGVGMTSNTIGAYFSGQHLPPVSAAPTVEKILGACGVPAGPARQAWLDALTRVRRLPGARPTDVPFPYRGLESYGTEDSPFFFGREKLVARLAALVMTSGGTGPTLVVGPSGSGKTSALHAGLAARLRTAGNWEVFSFTPGACPLESLEAALQSVRERRLPPGSRVAVIVDQFEELFVLCPHENERQTFIDQLTAPLQPGPGIGPAVTVVIALRADFYGAALRHEALSLALQDRQVVVGPMPEADLRRAITEPARAAGAQLHPGLVELVLHDMAPASLPLMSYALLQTWQRGNRSRLTIEDYVAAGGLAGAVSTAAESVFAELTPAKRALARQLFLRLVAVCDTAADVRRRATAHELGLDVPEGDALSDVLERFVAARLLTTTETTVEVAHEALLTAWPRLRTWLDDERAGLVTHRRLADAALTWERDGRDPGALHRGAALDDARGWAANPTHTNELKATERAFLDASVTAFERNQTTTRRRTRRARALLAGTSLLAVVASGLSVTTFAQRSAAERERDGALSRQLAETADRLRGTDPSAAGQFAVLAWRKAQTPEARSAILSASAVPVARSLDGPGGSTAIAVSGTGRVLAAVGSQGGLRIWTVDRPMSPAPSEVRTLVGVDAKGLSTVALNREGTVLVAGGPSGVLHAWDLSTPGQPVPLPNTPVTRAGVLGLAFSTDGRMLAVATGDSRVPLYNVQPGRGAATLTALGSPLQGSGKGLAIQAVAFSSNGKALAAAGSTGRVQLWTLTDRARPQPVPVQLTGPGGPIASLTFSPDGHRLVAASKDRRAYGWLLATPTAAPQRYEDAGDGVSAVAFSPDNTSVAAGGTDHHLRIYDPVTRVLTADLPHPGPVTTATYLPDGRTLVTGSVDGTVRLWPAPGPTAGLPTERAWQLAYLGSTRLGAASRHSLQIFDVSQRYRPRPVGLAVTAPGAPGASGSAGFSGAMATDRSGTILAAGGTGGTAWLYRAGSGPTTGPSAQLAGTVPNLHRGAVLAMALSPDGTTLVTAGDDGTLRVTEVSNPGSPRPLGTFSAGAGVTSSLAFGPDGVTLAAGTGTPNAVTFWDLRDREHPRRLGQPVTGPTAPVSSVAFSPDGHTLVVGAADHTVRLVDTSNHSHLGWLGAPLTGATDDITGVHFAPNGQTIAAASRDGAVRLWDVNNRTEPRLLATLTVGHPLRSVTFDRVSGRLAAAGDAATVWQWDLDPEAAVTHVCELAGAPMNRQVWTRYLPSVDYSQPCQGN